jgi:hypothetical protein
MLGCTAFKAVASNYPSQRSWEHPLPAAADLPSMDDMPPRVWVKRILQECATIAVQV